MLVPAGCQKAAPGESSENVNRPELAAELAVVARPRLLEPLEVLAASSALEKKAVP